MRRLHRDVEASILPLALMLFLALVWLMAPVTTVLYAVSVRALTQQAASAAALAGADAAVLEQRVDARGEVYCETVSVDLPTATAAASTYWQRNLTDLTSLTTSAFTVTASDNVVTVAATVQIPPGGLGLWGFGHLAWSLSAQATALYPDAVPHCS